MQMHDHSILIAQDHASHAAGQSKASLSRDVGSSEFRDVGQIIYLAGGARLGNAKIYQCQSVDGKRNFFALEVQFSIAPGHSDTRSDRSAFDCYPPRRL